MGQQFVFNVDRDVWFDCAFNRTDGNNIVFDVKINNQSDSAVLIAPSRFYQKAYSIDSFLLAENYAFDPETILINLKLAENIANAQATNAATFSICSALISTGATVVVAVSEKDKEKRDELFDVISTSNDLAQTSASLVMQSSDIRAENSWIKGKSLSELFLRKTTLPTGFFLEGEVHFPFYKDAKGYEITLEVGKAKVSFFFEQSLISPQTY